MALTLYTEAVLRSWGKSRIDGVIWHIRQSELSAELRSSLGGTVMTVTFVTREGPGTRLSKGLGIWGPRRDAAKGSPLLVPPAMPGLGKDNASDAITLGAISLCWGFTHLCPHNPDPSSPAHLPSISSWHPPLQEMGCSTGEYVHPVSGRTGARPMG